MILASKPDVSSFLDTINLKDYISTGTSVGTPFCSSDELKSRFPHVLEASQSIVTYNYYIIIDY